MDLNALLLTLLPFATDAAKWLWTEKNILDATASDTELLKEFLRLELRVNIGLIDSLTDAGEQWDPACVEVAKRLELTHLSSLLKPEKVYREFRISIATVELNPDDDGLMAPSEARAIGLALPYIIARTRSVIAFASMGQPPQGMRSIQLRRRLNNLRRDFDALRVAIDRSPGR
jgi:hypothetical protein